MKKIKNYHILLIIICLILAGCKNYIEVDNYTSSIGYAEYDEAYIAENDDKIRIEVPVVYELVHILMALTDYGVQDPYMLNKKGDYYERVMSYFDEFKDHEMIKLTQDALEQNGYYHIKYEATAYVIKDSMIENGGVYYTHTNFIEDNKEGIEKFIKDSNFEEFYHNNLEFYNDQINLFDEIIPLYDMKQWMENNYPNRYNSFLVIFSPLTGGSHNTYRYKDKEKDNDFEEALIFSASPDYYKTHLNDDLMRGIFMSNVFTEIDHNYVNPITDSKIAKVMKAFKNVEDWNQQNTYYRPTLTFNEYMTWSLFVLYIYDNMDEEEFEKVKAYQEMLMIKGRGFIKYKEFSEKLLEIYMANQDEKVVNLTDEIIQWARKN